MSAQITTNLQHVRARVDALSLRERSLLFAAVAMLMSATWYGLIMQPLVTRTTAAREEIAAVQARIDFSNRSLEEQISQYSSIDSEQQRRMQALEQRIDQINVRLGNYAAELIDPAEMARVLEDVLGEQANLKLIQVRNLEAEPVAGSGEGQTTTLYRHGLEIEFEGSYFACMEYLQDIEALPWRLYWQLIEINVEDYPRNRVRLAVSTLSLNEEWIGA